MGCCKSKSHPNKTHPECDLDSKFDGITIEENDKNKNMETMSVKLDKFIDRQCKFESSLKKKYESRKEFEFLPLSNNERVIKPFLSSTFRDFNEEREYLMADCFPLIEKKCNEKGLHFAPIDLRWGVTANQCNSGQVIKICLDEIDECRPYFLCFLGFRNGWSLCNGNKNDSLLLKTFDYAAKFCEYEWIYKHKQKSVTELEILYGAFLKNQQKFPNLRCIFYIKSVDYLKQQIESRQDAHSQFIDFGEAETNLMDLKKKIIDLKECKVRWFSSCQELGTLIKADMHNIIDADFKREQMNNPHKIFCNLVTNKVYIEINQIQSKLNKFLYTTNTKNVCIIYGDFGIGKTSVLANFDKNQRNNQKCLVISRFIGITNESVSICSLLKGVMSELYKNEKFVHLKTTVEIDDEQDENEIAEHLFALLNKIQSVYHNDHEPILLIFDAINHLLNKQQLQFINLMQQNNTNPKIKIILSTTTMNMNVLRSNAEQIKLSAMNKDEILIFIKRYLSQYGKVFDESQKKQIVDRFNENTVANPLFLSVFLEEMRSFGSFELLNEYIASYICAESICELFEKVMNRLHKEFCGENDILKHTLCLLHVSRNGLLPNELSLCLEQTLNVSKMEKTFPVFAYSSLIHQLTNLHFIRQINGKYVIIHQFIKDAVCSKYGQNFEFYQLAIYKTFIQMYEENDYANDSFLSQVPYSLSVLISDFGQMQFCENLINIISDIECIKYMKLPQNICDFDQYFSLTQLSISDCFKAKFDKLINENTNNQYADDQIAAYFHDLAIFMIDTGRYQQECEYFLLQSLHFYKSNALKTEQITFELAKLYQRQFKFAESMTAYKECIKILQKEGEKKSKLKLLIRRSALGGIYKELHRWNEAIETFESCLKEKIKILNDEHPLIAIDMVNIANIYVSSNQLLLIEKAHNLAISAQKIFEINFGADCLQLSTVYSLLANIHSFQNENNAAIKCLQNAKNIKESKLGKNNVEIVQCFNNLGAVYLKMKNMKNAKISFDKAMDLALNNENKQKLILCHRNLSNYHLLNEEYEKALSHLIESKDLMNEIFGDNHIKLIEPLLGLAKIYNERIKDYETAKTYFDKILSILDENGLKNNNNNVRMQCFNGLSILYLRHFKNYKKSIFYLDLQLEIISLSDKEKIDVLHDKIAVYLAQNDYVSAWQILKQILTEEKEQRKLIRTYNLCGNVMFSLNRQNEAIDFYQKEFKLQRTTELIQLLAILHFGNQNFEKSKKYFEQITNNDDVNEWLNDIKQAEMMLCA